jgi:hypothetical protein
MSAPETTFHSIFLSPSQGPQQALRLDECRRWVSITAEVGDLVIEVATRKEKDQSAWARLPADELFNFWLEAKQELWIRARLIDSWPGPDVVGPMPPPIVTLAMTDRVLEPPPPEPTGWISMVVCRDAA